MEKTDLKLPSGAVLSLTHTPFAESKALYQAILDEARGINFEINTEKMDINIKDLVCAGFASVKIEKALWVCMHRCLYNGQKITEDTFEPVESRGDYISVCIEVAKHNILPFMKSLSLALSQAQVKPETSRK